MNMNEPVVIVEGKNQNAFYVGGKFILASNSKLSDFTQLIMELGFEYTYVERNDIEAFPDKLSDLTK